MPEFQGKLAPRDSLGPCSAKISNTVPVPSPQIYWLHMVYAALGAICFTLVSKALLSLGRGTGVLLGRRGNEAITALSSFQNQEMPDFLGIPAISRSPACCEPSRPYYRCWCVFLPS